MRRTLGELAKTTIQTYRSRARRLWLKAQAGETTAADRLELAELEAVLGVRGGDIPPVGRPRKGVPMRPAVKAPFTVCCEEHLQDLIRQLDVEVTSPWGEAVPLAVFVNDVWQSAKREGYIEGHVQAQSDLYGDVHGHEPPESIVGDWRKHAGRKAMCGEYKDSS
ncbi:MAG: hypothetical protein WB780_10595 [Candidatus Acidiferrales bacterium]